MISSSGGRDSLIGRKLQEYVLESKLGVGGMGVVYKAVHPMIGKHVAIKVLRPDVVQDPRDMDRLLEEARVVSSIKNRGIINIFGAGTLEDGRHYLIMELLEGESLEQLMAREGKVNPGDAVLILEQTLSALAAAHEAGIVHRDLKPANIFLVKEANQVYVKLLDFGLARRQSQNVTRIAGTPDYISPEHARGRPAGPPADLYAFGVLCFHMLTGQLPFTGNTPMEVMEKHVHSAPPVPHEVNPGIPKALSELILKLLEKDPGTRPDATQVKADLRAATKALRNATTMMSLAAIEPVTGDAPAKGDKQRARALAVDAQVADLKRKVTRRWPIVLGAVVGVWLLGVLIYVLMPTTPEPVVTIKKPNTRIGDPIKLPDAVVKPADPVVVRPADPLKDPVAVKDPVVAPVVDAGVAVAPKAEVDAGMVVANLEEEDAGEQKVDLNAIIDDVRLGELRRGKDIDSRLDEVDQAIKQNAELKEMLSSLAQRTRKACNEMQTMKQFYDCDDMVAALYAKYLKNL
jgi:serine/threonine-protein kinase